MTMSIHRVLLPICTDRQITSVLGTWGMPGQITSHLHSNRAFDKALATGSLISGLAAKPWPAFSSPLLIAMILRRALNWKLLHIKPSVHKPGSNWINILPSTINQMLLLPFSLFSFAFSSGYRPLLNCNIFKFSCNKLIPTFSLDWIRPSASAVTSVWAAPGERQIARPGHR